MLDLEDVETFVEIADALGISPAARRLGVSKSVVSRRLLRLEAALGAQLLARTTRGTALTEAGLIFRDHAARISAEIAAARDGMLPEGELHGRLRIAMPLSLGPTHFVPAIARLALAHPQLHVHTSYSERFVDIVAEGFDCAIRIGALKDSNLVARRVGSIKGALVASPGYVAKYGAPEAPQDLARHEALMLGLESWQFLDGDAVVMVHPQGRFKADHGNALTVAAMAGLGVACLPESLVRDHIASGALVELMTQYPTPKVGVYVVRPPGATASRKVRLLTEFLIQDLDDDREDLPSRAVAGSRPG